MERKLATVQKINKISPIPGADRIDVANILGWNVVVEKDLNKENDLVVYCEIDSILPDIPVFEFMRKHKYRVKSVRMQQTLSQGLALPIRLFPNISSDTPVGTDVTSLLGVTKYEIPEVVYSGGNVEGPFPFYVSKTDEMRIQSFPELLEELRGELCYVTIKMDGTSGTFSHRDGEIKVCGRNMSYRRSENNAHWKVADKYNLIEKLPKMGNVALQGEVCGPGIQKNRIGLKGPELFIFNVYDINTSRILGLEDSLRICGEHELTFVPFHETKTFVLDKHTIDDLLAMADGKYPNGHPCEGIVIRPVVPRYSKILNGRASFKCINNQFLLKTGA